MARGHSTLSPTLSLSREREFFGTLTPALSLLRERESFGSFLYTLSPEAGARAAVRAERLGREARAE
jgi:hypothetical protein